ncbi:glutathione S-transferase family protein [Yunchengibacter salinarum]|uniref:glutathione S-transferase family protein n=1 Tax=Yunchengibacter salinarum TaxID=3133399 RepID=UPI0035B693D2
MAVLYHHWLSPAARFIRVLLSEKQVAFSLRLEKEWERREAFLKLNPAGEVPVLVLDDNTPVSGTLAMAELIEEMWPDPALLPEGRMDRYEVRRLIGWFHAKMGSEVTRHLVREKLFKRFLGMGEPDSEAVRCAAHNIHIHLKYIGYLASMRHYLAGRQFTMADAAAAAHISVADYFGDIDWADWPDVKDWYGRVKSRRSVAALLEDRIPGFSPPPVYSKIDF